MEHSRRGFLTTMAAGAVSLSTTGHARAGSVCCTDTDRSVPSEPDEQPVEPIIAETYGELDLSKENPCWDWEIPRFSEPSIIEYEVRIDDRRNAPDVIVVDSDGLEKYETHINTYPIFKTRTLDLPWFGSTSAPTGVYRENLNFDTLLRRLDQLQEWEEDSTFVEMDTLECLTEPRATQESHRVAGGSYYIIFDWTDDVLSERGDDEITAEVSVRARREKTDEAVASAPDKIASFYTGLPREKSPLAEAMVAVAETICDRVPGEVDNLSVQEIHETAPRAEQAVAATKIVFAVLKDKLGYNQAFIQELLHGAATWGQWGRSVLPIVNSLEHVLDNSCTVAQNQPETVTDDIENLLLNLGILVADLVMAKFGLASRIGSFAVKRAHKYLLGIVREVLGVKAYLVLLRELYTLTTSGLKEALGLIKDLTREISKGHKFFSEEEVDAIKEMETNELESLDFDWDLSLGPLSLSPECQP